ncbi:MAG: hypothetical protein PHW03_02350 [Eubacteriales bacterium]|nr:hypothetical protein [Eubacteriales bacterium]
MSKNTKKGYIAVEASILLPLFLVAIIAIGWLMKAATHEESVGFIAMNEGRRVAMTAYNTEFNPLFPVTLIYNIKQNSKGTESIAVKNYRYLYTSHGIDNLIHFTVKYEADAKLPFYTAAVSPKMNFTLRAFRGLDSSGAASYEELEKEEESIEVWVFPRYGERYHSEDCSSIKVYPVKKILSSKVRKSYDACRMCKSKNIADGSAVYCFSVGGSYHSGKCSTVDKYVIKMEREDAQSRGYTPCMKCGGGH